MKQKEQNRYVYHFLVDFRSTGVAEILDVHKYLMKKHDIEKFLGLLTNFLFYY